MWCTSYLSFLYACAVSYLYVVSVCMLHRSPLVFVHLSNMSHTHQTIFEFHSNLNSIRPPFNKRNIIICNLYNLLHPITLCWGCVTHPGAFKGLCVWVGIVRGWLCGIRHCVQEFYSWLALCRGGRGMGAFVLSWLSARGLCVHVATFVIRCSVGFVQGNIGSSCT